MKILPLLLLSVISFSCTTQNHSLSEKRESYFSGWIAEHEGKSKTLIFADCATGVTFPVTDSKASSRLKNSKKESLKNDKAVYIEFFGSIEDASGNSSTNSIGKGIRIWELIAVDSFENCYAEFTISGSYENIVGKNERELLTIRPDYTFASAHYIDGELASQSCGIWSLKNRDTMVAQTHSDKDHYTYDTVTTAKARIFNIFPFDDSISERKFSDLVKYSKLYIR